MKNIIFNYLTLFSFTFALLIGVSWSSYAQSQPQSAKEKIESMRVAYITNKIDLSTDEAKQLWPLYNEYQTDMQKLREKTELSDIERQEAELDIKKHYNGKFRSVIPNKLSDFYSADKEFRKMLIERMTGGGNRP